MRDACARSTNPPAPSSGSMGERLASFVTSFNSADVGEFRIVGTRGQYMRSRPMSTRGPGAHADYERQAPSKARRTARSVRAGAAYFSDCIQKRRQPEPSGEKACRMSVSSRRSTNQPRQAKRSPSRRSRIRPPGLRAGSILSGHPSGRHQKAKAPAATEQDVPTRPEVIFRRAARRRVLAPG